MRIEQFVPAEPGWRAAFKEPDGSESLSRILGWAAVGNQDELELVGIIIDPGEPSRIVAAVAAVSPAGGGFARYRYLPPEPTTAVAAARPAPASDDAAAKLAKSFFKRGR